LKWTQSTESSRGGPQVELVEGAADPPPDP
jgi:hypothetical protein